MPVTQQFIYSFSLKTKGICGTGEYKEGQPGNSPQ